MLGSASFHSLLSTLIQHQFLTDKEGQAAAAQCEQENKPLLSYLIENDLVNAQDVASLLSKEFSVPLFDLSFFELSIIPTEFISERLVTKHQAIPLFKRGNRLYIAIGDPTNHSALEEFQFNAGLRAEPILINEKQLQETISRIFESDSNALALNDFDEKELSDIEVDDSLGEVKQESDLDKDDQPIVIYINKLLMDAIRKGASDLHFEPYEKS